VRDIKTGRVLITGQNHGCTVDPDSVDNAVISHVNVNDGTVEGLRWRENVLSVQFRPDIEIIQEFIELMKG
jgi:carbamoyl-phosphate synthase small subunit